jgi:hypothetical protein
MNPRKRVRISPCAGSPIIRSPASASSADKDVLEELARATAGTPVDMPPQTVFKNEAGVVENRWIEITAVVNDDDDWRS